MYLQRAALAPAPPARVIGLASKCPVARPPAAHQQPPSHHTPSPLPSTHPHTIMSPVSSVSNAVSQIVQSVPLCFLPTSFSLQPSRHDVPQQTGPANPRAPCPPSVARRAFLSTIYAVLDSVYSVLSVVLKTLWNVVAGPSCPPLFRSPSPTASVADCPSPRTPQACSRRRSTSRRT